MKTLDRPESAAFSIAIVVAVIVRMVILIPMASSSVLSYGSYRSLSEWPGLVERDTKLPLTFSRLRYGHTDNFFDGTHSSVTIPETSYNNTKKLRFHNILRTKKMKGPKKNNKKIKKHKTKFANKMVLINIEDARSSCVIVPTQPITLKAEEMTVPTSLHENCELFGGLGTSNAIQSVVIVSLFATVIVLYRGWIFMNTRIPHNTAALVTSKTLIVS